MFKSGARLPWWSRICSFQSSGISLSLALAEDVSSRASSAMIFADTQPANQIVTSSSAAAAAAGAAAVIRALPSWLDKKKRPVIFAILHLSLIKISAKYNLTGCLNQRHFLSKTTEYKSNKAVGFGQTFYMFVHGMQDLACRHCITGVQQRTILRDETFFFAVFYNLCLQRNVSSFQFESIHLFHYVLNSFKREKRWKSLWKQVSEAQFTLDPFYL